MLHIVATSGLSSEKYLNDIAARGSKYTTGVKKGPLVNLVSHFSSFFWEFLLSSPLLQLTMDRLGVVKIDN